jgi:predicted permease
MPESEYPDDDKQLRFAEDVLAKVQALPGVVTAALATDVAPNAPRYAIKFPGKTYAQERDYPFSRGATVSADYFKVLRSGVMQGRTFDVQDHAGAPLVAVVNQSFARRFLPDGALGQQFALAQGSDQQWRTIVGIVPDLGFGETSQGQVREGFYLPMAQLPPSSFAVVIHAAGIPLDLVAPLREAVRSVDENMPIANVNTLQQQKDQGTWAFRVFGSLFMAFGFAALILAAVGLYGVMAFSVSRRTQEIGVRMALGAKGVDVLRLVLQQGLWQVALGILIGVGLAAGLASAMQALLFQVRPYDPVMFTTIALVLSATALVACLIPARRASRVDPMVALRYH